MVSSLRHVQCDVLGDQKDYSVLVHFLSFFAFEVYNSPDGFCRAADLRSGYGEGRAAAAPSPEEGAAQAACSDERAELRKPQRPKLRTPKF